jgi:hypothetical protein
MTPFGKMKPGNAAYFSNLDRIEGYESGFRGVATEDILVQLFL